jgi:hypothetical protein
MTQEELKPYTFGELIKEKNKKFLFKFSNKTINKKKIPIVYFNYEYRGELTDSTYSWLRLDKYWHVFQGVLLRNMGHNYEVMYNGKMNKKFAINWQDLKNSIEEVRKMKELNEKRIQYEFPFCMLDLNQDPKLSAVFEKLENLRCIF